MRRARAAALVLAIGASLASTVVANYGGSYDAANKFPFAGFYTNGVGGCDIMTCR